MAKFEKRQGCPRGQAIVSERPPSDSKCAICRDPANKRFFNSWRVVDVCLRPECISQGTAWAGNSPFSKRVTDPPRIWRQPVETKFLSRKAEAVPQPPGARARAR